MNKSDCHRFLIKAPRADSIFIYNLFHAEEGIASVRTIERGEGTVFCLLEAMVSPYYLNDFHALVEDIRSHVPVQMSQV